MSIVFGGRCYFRHTIRESASASDVHCRSEWAHWFDRLIDHLPAPPDGGQGPCHMDIQDEAHGVIGSGGVEYLLGDAISLPPCVS